MERKVPGADYAYDHQQSAGAYQVFCFNFPVDRYGQLTNTFDLLGQRVFEWVQGEAHKVRLELKVQFSSDDPNLDPLLLSVEGGC
jgi:hypothetical protein